MKISVKSLKSGKVRIFADGEFAFDIPEIIKYRLGISDGDEMNEEELLSVKKEGNSSFAYEAALRSLSYRAHSKKELAEKLSLKYGSDAAKTAVERCEAAGLIDDTKFAESYASELYERKNFSERRILSELRAKGIDRDIAENAVNGIDIDKNKGIINIINKMRPEFPLSEKDKNRIIRRLLSMGYSFYDIKKYTELDGLPYEQDDEF